MEHYYKNMGIKNFYIISFLTFFLFLVNIKIFYINEELLIAVVLLSLFQLIYNFTRKAYIYSIFFNINNIYIYILFFFKATKNNWKKIKYILTYYEKKSKLITTGVSVILMRNYINFVLNSVNLIKILVNKLTVNSIFISCLKVKASIKNIEKKT